MTNPPGGPYQQGSAPEWGQQGWDAQGQQGWDAQGQQSWGSANPQPGGPVSQPTADFPGTQPSANPWTGQQSGGWDPNQGQQWGQQAGGQDPNSAWAHTWTDTSAQQPKKKGVNPIIPIAVAIAVLLAGVGIWALTRNNGDDDGDTGGGGGKKAPAAASIEKFFEMMNTDKPNSWEYEKIIDGVGSMAIMEAVNNSPGGTWKVTSIGEQNGDKVPVTFTHEKQEFKHDFQVIEEDGTWKLVKPFASVTFKAPEERLNYKLNEQGSKYGKEFGSKELHYPGVYSLIPAQGYSSTTIRWAIKNPKVVVKPGETKEVKVQVEPTKEWKEEAGKAVTAAFQKCLKTTDSFSLYDCPFRVSPSPDDAAYPYEVIWSVTPADAPTKLEYVPGTVNKPCFKVPGEVSFEYLNRDGKHVKGKPDSTAMKGCYDGNYVKRVSWES